MIYIDIVYTNVEAEEEDPGHAAANFCAFDWLKATFVNERYVSKTYFDIFRAVAKVHMNRMLPNSHIQTCESR